MSNIKELQIVQTITKRMMQLIILYFFFSPKSNGFAGVSKGDSITIVGIDINVNSKTIVCTKTSSDLDMIIVTHKNDNVVKISHFVSVSAWYPPAKILMAQNET